MYSNGFFEVFSKLLISLIAIFINVMFGAYFGEKKDFVNNVYFRTDLIPLFFSMLLGSFVLISSNDFLTFLIAFELIAIPSYFVIAMDNKNKMSLEGSIKYFLIGSVATVSLLISILVFYIYSGSLVFDKNFSLLVLNLQGVKIAFTFFVLAIFIKLAVFPLSFWVQDAYEASRAPYLLVISTLPKIAVMTIFIKIIFLDCNGLPIFLSVFSALSMILGTFWALTSNSIKRILAFSTITNMGYILIPFTSLSFNIFNNSQALSIVYFYIFQYVLSTILFVSVLTYLEGKYDTADIRDLKGVLSKNSFLSVFLIISLLSLAGLPPTVGFVAKFFLFSYSYSFSPILVWIGIITSVVSLYFYYKIAQYLYVNDEKKEKYNEDIENKIDFGFLPTFSSVILTTFILFLGIFPGSMINIINFIILSLSEL
ncbi:MAG: NADH-quinone oxidoreductase subunit N [bacterium]